MTDRIARLLEPFLRILFPPRGRRRRSPALVPCPYACPYCHDGVRVATPRRPTEPPLRGEDNRLVRRYVMAEAGA
ncbi:hypothetical protein GCM10010313_46000 [Streptomyces violarus]|uniref:Uncharacterized protein n=1 Tax=Streptomyces violarus TaxID=67380 RepID=A0A7W5F260_9ACTN|nr:MULTISPECIES: hypothetical protein [Streptomyces]MBB3077265.1 hypothetical protein [Streptomyces violarus]WRU01104.1 hypothetical protein VJ737_27015 [Streptomyces sp. CGMCC 4.1772]GHD17062.1 hypothetical protein GCM10010313_46000 [Streptomyces violarus]